MSTFGEIWEERQRISPTPWDSQTRQIIDALKALGIREEDISTNGYRFTFPYKDLVVEVFNQGSGLSGIIHKKPSTPTERACLDDADEILSAPRFSLADRMQFVTEFGYRKVSYTGDPVSLVARIIRDADTPVTSLPMDYLFRG